MKLTSFSLSNFADHPTFPIGETTRRSQAECSDSLVKEELELDFVFRLPLRGCLHGEQKMLGPAVQDCREEGVYLSKRFSVVNFIFFSLPIFFQSAETFPPS
jgi:hypothetical protein